MSDSVKELYQELKHVPAFTRMLGKMLIEDYTFLTIVGTPFTSLGKTMRNTLRLTHGMAD